MLQIDISNELPSSSQPQNAEPNTGPQSRPWEKAGCCYLHHVDKVQEELLGVLLPIGGEFRVAFAHQRLKHTWGNAVLNSLQRERTR